MCCVLTVSSNQLQDEFSSGKEAGEQRLQGSVLGEWGRYLSAGPQVVDDSLDSVHHLQPHLLLLRSWGDVVEEVVDLLVQPAEQARTRFEGKFSREKASSDSLKGADDRTGSGI